MPYIYKITNQINNKNYIGKTLSSIEQRWKEHVRDSQKEENQNRPLYKAFNKYGIDNFIIEKIEECSADVLSEKEIYWINFYNSFNYGYNATKGGDGKQTANYELIYNLYSQGNTYEKITNLLGCDHKTIENALDNFNILKQERKNNSIKKISKPVARIDINTNEILEILPSIREADRKYSTGKHVAEVCNGKRKTAGGFKWKYI